MKKQQLEILIESLTPKVYGLCFAMTGDARCSEQLFIDAYTVFLLEEKEFISQDELPSGDQEMRLSVKRFLFNTFSKHVYQLALNKNRYSKKSELSSENEFELYYQLKPQQRALLFLKEKLDLRLQDLQEVFALKRYQVIEFIHNANYSLNSDMVEIGQGFKLDEVLKHQVNALVNRTLPLDLIRAIEEKINADTQTYHYYQERLRLKEFTQSLIPEGQISFQSRKEIGLEVSAVNEDIFPKESFHALKKFSSFMTTPIIEI